MVLLGTVACTSKGDACFTEAEGPPPGKYTLVGEHADTGGMNVLEDWGGGELQVEGSIVTFTWTDTDGARRRLTWRVIPPDER